MQSVSDFKLLCSPPTIKISRKGIQAIKEIVELAPQEAQWFHTVTYNSQTNEILIGDELYIPEQVCSATEVDSSSAMMVEFYKELSKKHDMETVNSILSSMTCWCHSHHNMAPNPSMQDVRQLISLVNQSIDQNLSRWQVMLIFNKKDQFYSRVYDPNSGNIYEGLNIVVQEEEYDFQYISDAAKTKFKTPTPKLPTKLPGSLSPWISGKSSTPKAVFPSSSNHLDEDAALNRDIAYSIINRIYLGKAINTVAILTQEEAKKAIAIIKDIFDDKEYLWLSMALSNKYDKILNYFSDDKVDLYNASQKNADSLDKAVIKYFTTTKATILDFENTLLKILNISNEPSLNGFVATVKKSFFA